LKPPTPLKRINLNWWACFGDDPRDWYRFTHHAAYFHFTGLCSGGKVWRLWIVSQRKLGYMTTPVIVIDGAVIVGFDSDALSDRGCRIQIRHNEDMKAPVRFAKRIGVRYPLAVAVDDLKQKFGGIEGLPTTPPL
jgi:hypothetical protein